MKVNYLFSLIQKNNNAYLGVEKVRNFIKTVDGFKKITIIERQKNYGLTARYVMSFKFPIGVGTKNNFPTDYRTLFFKLYE